MDGTLYRALVAAVCALGFGAGLTYLWLYRPSQWRSPAARDSSGWVLALTLFFAWSLYRTVYALAWGPEGTRIEWGFGLSSLVLGGMLVWLVLYRLHRFRVAMAQEREHPTEVCTRCKGMGVVLKDAAESAPDRDLPDVREQGPGGALPEG